MKALSSIVTVFLFLSNSCLAVSEGRLGDTSSGSVRISITIIRTFDPKQIVTPDELVNCQIETCQYEVDSTILVHSIPTENANGSKEVVTLLVSPK